MGIWMRYLEVRKSDDTVVNVIIWDGIAPYNYPGTYLLLEVPGVQIGWYLKDGEWIDPNPPVEDVVELEENNHGN
jgi:hypothetical protein